VMQNLLDEFLELCCSSLVLSHMLPGAWIRWLIKKFPRNISESSCQ
jgi:hypothetical protein